MICGKIGNVYIVIGLKGCNSSIQILQIESRLLKLLEERKGNFPRINIYHI